MKIIKLQNIIAQYFGLSFNGNYHFNTVLEIPKDWDLYAGLNHRLLLLGHQF